MATILIPVVRATQNIGDLYVGVMSARDLIAISQVDRLRLSDLKIPKYAGYQRGLLPERVAEIRDFLNTPRSTFPNAIILSLDSEYVEKWDDLRKSQGVSVLHLQKEPGAAQIIDGQHRAAALDAAPEDFQVIVSLFIDLDIVQSAEIFAKINSTQKSVNPSIAFQLFGYSPERSPQRTAHDIATVLNTKEGSPFYKRLRMLGTKDGWAIGTLSQATFAKHLMRLYTRKPREDENKLLRGDRLDNYPGYPLRQFFMGAADDRILSIVWKFFYNVAETWPDQWTADNAKSILVKTTGYAALLEVMRRWLQTDRSAEIINDDNVGASLAAVKGAFESRDTRFLRANYPAGNQGVQKLRDLLLADLGLAS